MEIEKLKIRAYDLIAQLQAVQNELAQVNQKITELSQKEIKPETSEMK